MGISASKHLSSVNNEYRQTAVFFFDIRVSYNLLPLLASRFSLLASPTARLDS
jgi:hypothetical protein